MHVAKALAPDPWRAALVAVKIVMPAPRRSLRLLQVAPQLLVALPPVLLRCPQTFFKKFVLGIVHAIQFGAIRYAFCRRMVRKMCSVSLKCFIKRHAKLAVLGFFPVSAQFFSVSRLSDFKTPPQLGRFLCRIPAAVVFGCCRRVLPPLSRPDFPRLDWPVIDPVWIHFTPSFRVAG